MARGHSLTIVLDDDSDDRLTQLAQRSAVDKEDLAGSLLVSLLGGADVDAERLTATLDAIPGAFERAETGRAQGAAGKALPLDQI